MGLPPQPWPNPRAITVSFAPDFVEIGRYRNELFLHLNDHLSFPDWQMELLRAFQSWSRHCGVQFAWAPDSSRAFGVPGLSQSDPRFGDIRLGAFPQSNVLGNVIAFHPAHGSWAGDILLDSNRQFYLHDWSSPSIPNDQYDLYTVALHEIGNSLGLVDDDQNPQSVMYANYIGPRNGLSSSDILQAQLLYGPPIADDLEPFSGNGTFQSASTVSFPPEFAQTLIATSRGRIQGPTDVDVYRFEVSALAENCWLKLRAKRHSLLCGRITAYDEQLNELATIAASSPLQNTVIKEITSLEPGEIIYVVVQSAEVPDFDFGDYQLVLDFNSEVFAEQGEEGDDDDDNEDRFFEAMDRDLVNELYDETGLIDPETDSDSKFRNAMDLYNAPGFPSGSRFEAVGSIASSTDKDAFRIQTSRFARGSMAIELTPLTTQPSGLELSVFDESKTRLKTTIRYRQNGEVFLEVPRVQASSIYYIQVSNRPGNSVQCNYLLLSHVANQTAKLQTVQEFQLSAAADDQFGVITNYKTHLYRFDLSMTSTSSATQAAQMTIYSGTGYIESVTTVRAGENSAIFVWLHAGDHYIRLTAKPQCGASVLPSSVTLRGGAVSDDKGPILIDPSGNPISDPQTPGTRPNPLVSWAFPLTYSWLYQLAVPTDNPWL